MEQVSLPGDFILGKLSLRSGETVWLQARWTLMNTEEMQGVDSVSKEFMGFKTSGLLSNIDPWAIWIATGGESPIFVQFPLGKHHFAID